MNDTVTLTKTTLINDTSNTAISNESITRDKFKEFESVTTESFKQLAIENRELLSKFNRINKIQNRNNWLNRKKRNTKQYK